MKNLFDKADQVVVKTGFVGFMMIVAAQLGILFPVLVLLLLCMVVDYITGIISAGYQGKIEFSIGLRGIVKKLLYSVIVAVVMTLPGLSVSFLDKFKHLIVNEGSTAVDAVNVKETR